MNKPNPKHHSDRNNSVVDAWSFVHLAVAACITFIVGPLFAIAITFLWEPLENFVISPLLGKCGILFGHETFKNSLFDLIFNAIGVAGAHVVLSLV